jgi:hypothetical protein
MYEMLVNDEELEDPSHYYYVYGLACAGVYEPQGCPLAFEL